MVESHSRVQGRGRLGGLRRGLWGREGRLFLDLVGCGLSRWFVWRGICISLLQKTGGVSACIGKGCCCATCHGELLEARQAMKRWFSCDERRLKEKEREGDIIAVIIVPVVLVFGMSDEADACFQTSAGRSTMVAADRLVSGPFLKVQPEPRP